MRERKFRLILILLCVAGASGLLFQNCSQKPFTLAGGVSAPPPHAMDIAPEQVMTIEFAPADLATIQPQGSTDQQAPATQTVSTTQQTPPTRQALTRDQAVKGSGISYRYELELETGNLIDREQGQVVKQLSAEEAAELGELLAKARVEDAEQKYGPDIVCTMDYRLPYARLYFDGAAAVELGEGSSGCPKVDLYDRESGARLRLDQLLTQLLPTIH